MGLVKAFTRLTTDTEAKQEEVMKDKQHEGSMVKSFRFNVEELGDVDLSGWRMLREIGSLTKGLLMEYEAQEGLIRCPALMVRSGGCAV